MNIAMSWIKEFVDIKCNALEFADAMTLTGTKVESIKNKGKYIKNVVVCKVLEIEKHKDADKLFVTKVDIGKEEHLQIVTAATNLFVGAIVPVALDGATLASGLKIKNSKLRGVMSNGMFCSIEELGFTKNDYPDAPEDGIYIFDKEYPLGSSVNPIFNLDEDIIEFEITSNRADCYSVIGIAREASATFKTPLKIENISFKGEIQQKISDFINIKIENKDICKRYTCRVVKDVKIEPSPLWLRQKLISSGIRPINNIVDITNYIMLEYGQPMHAYDLNKIEGKHLTIRNAKEGEQIKTLDGVSRTLDEHMLVIQDENKLVDLAGVMGLENSMITEDTKDILLEAANFDGYNIRTTAKKLGLRTDASSKFEKNIDPNLCLKALDRACMLIEQLNIGKVIKEHFDFYENVINIKEINYSADNINKLLGTNIPNKEMIDLLKLIEIDADETTAKIPTFRQDITNDADLAEEIIRLYGYDKISTNVSNKTQTVGKKSYKQIITEQIKNVLIYTGFNEVLTYSFESPKVFEKLNITADDDLTKAITINNPLGEDFSIMRTTTLNSMLNCIAINYKRRNKEAFLFEIGKIYLPEELPLKNLPKEEELISVALYGDIDFYNAKGAFENLFNSLNINKQEYTPFTDLNFMHPGRTAKITINNEYLGYVGEVSKKVLQKYDIDTRVYYGILHLDKLINFANTKKTYAPLPKFPAIERDISIVIKEDILAKDLENAIKQKAGKLLEEIKLFDIYKGSQIEQGFKSLSYSLLFRSAEKTLTDEEVNKYMEKALNFLQENFKARLRDK